MSGSAQHEASHGDVDHGLCYAGTLLVILYKPAPADIQPDVRSTTQRRSWTSNPFAVFERRMTSRQLSMLRRVIWDSPGFLVGWSWRIWPRATSLRSGQTARLHQSIASLCGQPPDICRCGAG